MEIRLSSKCSEVVGLRGLSEKSGVVSSSSSSGRFCVLSINMRSSSCESSPSRFGSSLGTGRRESGIGGAPSPLLLVVVLPLLSSSLCVPSLLSGCVTPSQSLSSSPLLCQRKWQRERVVCCAGLNYAKNYLTQLTSNKNFAKKGVLQMLAAGVQKSAVFLLKPHPQTALTSAVSTHTVVASMRLKVREAYHDVELSGGAGETVHGGAEVVGLSRECQWLHLIVNTVLLVFPGQSVPTEEHIHYHSVQPLRYKEEIGFT